MSLRRFVSLVTCFAFLSPSILPSYVNHAQSNARKQDSKKTKKNKRKKQSGSVPVVLPTYSIPSAPTVLSSPSEESKSTSPGGRVMTRQQVSTKSVQEVQEGDGTIKSASASPVIVSTVNIRNLTQKSAKGPSLTVVNGRSAQQAMPVPGTIQEPVDAPTQEFSTKSLVDSGGPLDPSPGPVQNFPGEFDEAVGGGSSGTFTIPPDTMGAVGIDKIVSAVNNNIVVHDKATGNRLSVVSLSSFWTSTGATGVFDPRIIYDPYNNRWIVAAVSSAQSANSSVLIGISDNSDPQGTYTLFRFIAGCAPGSPGCNAAGGWADFPMLGFNKNWVVITWNQFTINTLAFTDGRALVLDYPTLRSGTAIASLFSGATATIGGFCMHPATTFSPTEDTLYLPTHIGSAGATYRLHKITGTPASPAFTVDSANRTRPGGGWTQPGGDALPQQCIPAVGAPGHTCPVTIRQIDVGDAFIRGNVVFRNGKIYYPQTVALPAGGLTNNSRFAAQWTALNTDGTFSDGGRVEDATATRINGGKHYAYPSISVNKNDVVLLGFSEFESDDYADAGYSVRLPGDAAGTMREPVIYKEGEDYYQKTFSGTRNRWGDYSHTVVDPVNDLDLWTLQEFAGLRVGTTGQGSNDSRWATQWAKIAAPAGAGDLMISEFRLRGPGGPNDEFVEIYNPSSSPHTVSVADGSAGYSLVASDGTTRFTIPVGTVIPAKGHYLGVNSAYSLSGNSTGDVTYSTDIPDNAGIALFSTSTPANFILANRIDAVGSTSEANTLYKEGTGYPSLTPFSIDYSFYRSFCPGNTPVFGTALGCVAGGGGQPKDSNDNAADFVFVDTNGTFAGFGQRLGAPGPENLASPIEHNTVPMLFLDTSAGASTPPNRVRDFTSDPLNNSTFGTLDIRRRVQNNTGAPVTRLRFRIIDINTFPATSGFADLRARTSTLVVVSGINDAATCLASNGVATTPCTVNVQGTTLEQPPSQLNGGAFNSTQSAGTITLGTPLANGASINVRFLLGIQQTGNFRFFVNVETLP